MTPEEREAWLARRLTGLGGSDIAAADTGRYGGAAKVVGQRLGLGDPDPIDPALAERGHRWETTIADAVHAVTGLYVHGEQTHLSHRGRPRDMCTPDGLLSPHATATWSDLTAGLEIKTRHIGAPWAWDYWRTQAQWGCHVAGLPRWLLAVATITDDYDPHSQQLVEQVVDLRLEWVDHDPFEAARLVGVADELWSWVERRQLPPADGPEALQWVKAANALADTGAAADIDHLDELLERWTDLKAAMKQAADEVALAEARIREAMGAATEAYTTDGTWRVRCGTPVRKFTAESEADFAAAYRGTHPELWQEVLDRAAAKAALPDDYDRLRQPTTDRRLTIKRLKETE